ncbi:MAG TPA: hypothetical protein VFD92_10910 [Candidatus Binatia bacterium]|nr:hypothetical protein [Candidatus Binatia bacterium]
MIAKGEGGRNAASGRNPGFRAALAAALLVLSGCSLLGPPPMEPLSATTLEAAERRWDARGSDSYHLVVRVRAPRFEPAVYDLVVSGGKLVAIERNGAAVPPGDAHRYDYSVAGLFGMLQQDLRLADVPAIGDVPAVDLRAEFEPATGRLVCYRRTVGAARRRVLLVEVLQYEPTASPAATA